MCYSLYLDQKGCSDQVGLTLVYKPRLLAGPSMVLVEGSINEGKNGHHFTWLREKDLFYDVFFFFPAFWSHVSWHSQVGLTWIHVPIGIGSRIKPRNGENQSPIICVPCVPVLHRIRINWSARNCPWSILCNWTFATDLAPAQAPKTWGTSPDRCGIPRALS